MNENKQRIESRLKLETRKEKFEENETKEEEEEIVRVLKSESHNQALEIRVVVIAEAEQA